MRLFSLSLLLLGCACVATADAQPPQGKGPPPFVLGKVLPPHIREGLELTKEQEQQLADLEKEVKQRLEKILTDAQKKQIEAAGPPRPLGRPEKPRRPEEGAKPSRPDPVPAKDNASAKANSAIAWFATLERGLAEASRSGKPIFFLSAAPHCGGISGIW